LHKLIWTLRTKGYRFECCSEGRGCTNFIAAGCSELQEARRLDPLKAIRDVHSRIRDATPLERADQASERIRKRCRFLRVRRDAFPVTLLFGTRGFGTSGVSRTQCSVFARKPKSQKHTPRHRFASVFSDPLWDGLSSVCCLFGACRADPSGRPVDRPTLNRRPPV
jgi:hypothetical protein